MADKFVLSIYANNSQFSYLKRQQNMSNILYVIAVFLVISWAIGFIGFNAGGLIHILLVLAIISVLIRIIQGRSFIK